MIVPRRRALGAFAGWCFLARLPAARAADELDEQEPSAFGRLFPEPTGRNGYEELVFAGDLARRLERRRPIPSFPTPTLELHRSVLADLESQRALRRMRAGLAMQIRPPAGALVEDEDPLFDAYAGMRAVARLVVLEQRTALADGRVGDAVRFMDDGLRLGDAVKGDSLLGGLVGAAVDHIVTARLVFHRAQWSARDCDRIIGVAEAWRSRPDPGLDALEGERRRLHAGVHRMLAELAAPDGRVLRSWEEAGGGGDPKRYAALRAELKRAAADPAYLAQVIAAAHERIDAALNEAVARVRDPRLCIAPADAPGRAAGDSGADIVGAVTGLLMIDDRTTVIKLAQARVNLHLLAAHAALRRHQWEFAATAAASATASPSRGRCRRGKRASRQAGRRGEYLKLLARRLRRCRPPGEERERLRHSPRPGDASARSAPSE